MADEKKKKKPERYICSNMREDRHPFDRAFGVMHLPPDVTRAQVESWFGRKLVGPPPQQLIYNEVVKVQPMSAPASLVFYMDYTYGSDIKTDKLVPIGEASRLADGTPLEAERGLNALAGSSPALSATDSGSEVDPCEREGASEEEEAE